MKPVRSLVLRLLVSAEGQNLNFAIPVEKVPAGLVQLPSEQLVASAQPTATPTPAIDAKAHCNRGRAFLDKKLYENAVSDFIDAIRLIPNDATAYEHRGSAYLRTGNRARADADFATAKRLKGGR